MFRQYILVHHQHFVRLISDSRLRSMLLSLQSADMHCFNSVDAFLHRSNCATHAANAKLLLQQLVLLLLILLHI